VTLDGATSGDSYGVDTASDGSGGIRSPGSISSSGTNGPIVCRTFEIEFLGSGVQAVDFTFD
jgi:hypothetical protein